MSVMTVGIEENEFWWGGSVSCATEQPYNKNSSVKISIEEEVENQSAPLYLSSKGRYIHAD